VSLASDIMNSGDVWAAIAELRRMLMDLTSGRRLEDASIGARGLRLLDGGSFTINGGALRMTDETGSIGLLFFGPGTDGHRIWAFSFDDGEFAFGLQGSVGRSYWAGYDRQGNLLLSNDGQTGVGLARPYVALRLVPSSEAQISGTSFYPSHTNTTFTRLWTGFNAVFHPRVQVGVATATSGGGSSRWRLVVNGTDTTGEVTGSGIRSVAIPGWGTTVKPGNTVEFAVEGRIADGGTRVFVNVDRFFALQS
jgi:hypothetical protein